MRRYAVKILTKFLPVPELPPLNLLIPVACNSCTVELTDWFPSHIKPMEDKEHQGVYEVSWDLFGTIKHTGYSRWNGLNWSRCYLKMADMAAGVSYDGACQEKLWRGVRRNHE